MNPVMTNFPPKSLTCISCGTRKQKFPGFFSTSVLLFRCVSEGRGFDSPKGNETDIDLLRYDGVRNEYLVFKQMVQRFGSSY